MLTARAIEKRIRIVEPALPQRFVRLMSVPGRVSGIRNVRPGRDHGADGRRATRARVGAVNRGRRGPVAVTSHWPGRPAPQLGPRRMSLQANAENAASSPDSCHLLPVAVLGPFAVVPAGAGKPGDAVECLSSPGGRPWARALGLCGKAASVLRPKASATCYGLSPTVLSLRRV